jgi:hypothetical protein
MPWSNKVLTKKISKEYADGELIIKPPVFELLILDERGQTGAEIIAGLGAAVGAILKFMDHPVTAYLVVLAILAADAGISSLIFSFQGGVGLLFQVLINTIFGLDIPIYSWELLIIFAVLPLLIWAMKGLLHLIFTQR